MLYCSSPLSFVRDSSSGGLAVSRPLTDATTVIDNWIDIVVFTSVRRFKADEDFGFRFWDNEFIAMNLEHFNKGIDYASPADGKPDSEREHMSSAGIRECERSIRDSINFYVPYLKDVNVNVHLSYERDRSVKYSKRSERSKYVVRVSVTGRTVVDDYAGTRDGMYEKTAVFFMDPFLKK
jgi:hypothetical protein